MNEPKEGFRTAPQVDKLSDLKKIIKSLEFIAIPYSYIDSRNIEELKENKSLSDEIFEQIISWKTDNNFRLSKGYFSEIVSLLRELEIIKTRTVEDLELDLPLGGTGPILRNIANNKKIQIAALTDIGYEICSSINDYKENLKIYDSLLFWRFLKSRIVPIWQRLIERKESFTNTDIREILKNMENDKITISSFLKWTYYFDLIELNSSNPNLKILNKYNVALRVVHSTIHELNHRYVSEDAHYVQNLASEIAVSFKISPTYVDFFRILEIILDINKRKNIVGTTSGRSEKSLPGYPRINMLKIISKIPIFPDFDRINQSKLLNCIHMSDNDE